MATLPAGQPGVPLPGDRPGARAPRRLDPRLEWGALAAVAGGLALSIAIAAHAVHPGAVVEGVRGVAATLALFAVCGFGLTRLLLPDGLRSWEPLWVLPTGACASGLAMTVLGFAYLPFKLSLAVTLVAGAVLGVVALRRAGPPARPSVRLAWPVWLAALLACVALVPYFRAGHPTVIGEGSDAHLAVGAAQFLQHNYPTSVNANEPVDRMPLVWRSKYPIYYALGASSTLAGLEPFETIAIVAAVMLALAALGWFLVARHLLGAGLVAAGAAMGVAGLDRMVLHTGMHPYFNQTWGYFTLPWALILAWWAVAQRTRGGLALLALFLAVGAFAYPLALPIPLLALLVFWRRERRARRARGEPVSDLSWRRLYRSRRSLLWIVPVCLVLIVPLSGVAEKIITASKVIGPGSSLAVWGGDLRSFVPDNQFYALSFAGGLAGLAILGLWILGWRGLRERPGPIRWGLGILIVVGVLVAGYFRQRDGGWYFHFKTLAFVAPLILVCAVAGAARWRRVGPVLILALLVTAQASARQEIGVTFDPQTSRDIVDLKRFERVLPPNASVRLDTKRSAEQIWVGYMLSGQRLCSEHPLLHTQYPRVPFSRKAEYVLVQKPVPRPRDAVGGVVVSNPTFRVYRMSPKVPGPDRCSRRTVDEVTKIGTFQK